MNRTATPSLAADSEISALIATLHATGQRLQQLTSGEVDTVADQHGHTFVLREAQVHLRHHEAAKQASILNALPANIALIDTRGMIVSVNEAWKSFSPAGAASAPGAGVGSNYLEICDRAEGSGSAEARRAAHGVRAVLDGTEKSFSFRYACHSPTRQRWFLMTATPLADGHTSGAVVMHLDITDRVEIAHALDQQGAELRVLVDLLPAMIWFKDTGNRILRINQQAADAVGRTVADIEGRPCAEIYPDEAADYYADDRLVIDSGAAKRGIIETIRDPAGNSRCIQTDKVPYFNLDGQVAGLVVLSQDITESRLAEVRIRRLNRGYLVLSQINALIVGESDRDRLFREACRIAVETGEFRHAWIGLVDHATLTIVPAASAGRSSDGLQWAGESLSQRDGALAVHARQAVIVNDVSGDPRTQNTETYAEAGVRALVVLPVFVAGDVVAVFGLHAGDVDYFDAAEMDLLRELANDIGFAIDHIGKAERLSYLAYYDALTGLANRTLFLERAGQRLRSAAGAGHGAALVLIDLERFKSINDSLGQTAGNELLRQVATWLSGSLQDATAVGRVDADHFVVMLPEADSPGDTARYLQKLIADFHDHAFPLEGAVFRIAARFGVALFPDDASDAENLFRKAESALKSAQASGSRHAFYTQTMTASVARRLSLENQLRQALDNDEFVLHYQPKISAEGRVTSAEALIRWNDPRTGLTLPGQFISILEETGLIHDVGRWALRQAIIDYQRWRDAATPAVRLAVNVSPLQLRNPDFVDEVRQLLNSSRNGAEGLELEITEGMIMADIDHSIASLQALRGMGVRVAIDDFGTGFSSLAYLARLPVDSLKIDRSFINDMTQSPQGLVLVSTMITLAHSLSLKVVAEGVENQEQSSLLRLLQCDEVQGNLYGKAVPRDVFEAMYLAVAQEAATPVPTT